MERRISASHGVCRRSGQVILEVLMVVGFFLATILVATDMLQISQHEARKHRFQQPVSYQRRAQP